jgi:hypothetical protein
MGKAIGLTSGVRAPVSPDPKRERRLWKEKEGLVGISPISKNRFLLGVLARSYSTGLSSFGVV